MEDPQTTSLSDPPQFEHSSYFQMRALLCDLRPNFIEVLRTPDFRNCEAATEIRGKMKVFMDLYKEMTAETITLEKCKTEQQRRTKTEHASPDDDEDMADPTAENPKQGTYVVGGSAFGWNYVMFPGANIAVYYGRTKEAFRSAQSSRSTA